MLVPKYDRFARPHDDWDEDDDCSCGRSLLASVLVACAPVALKYYLDTKAEERRRADALANPELYGVDYEDEDE